MSLISLVKIGYTLPHWFWAYIMILPGYTGILDGSYSVYHWCPSIEDSSHNFCLSFGIGRETGSDGMFKDPASYSSVHRSTCYCTTLEKVVTPSIAYWKNLVNMALPLYKATYENHNYPSLKKKIVELLAVYTFQLLVIWCILIVLVSSAQPGGGGGLSMPLSPYMFRDSLCTSYLGKNEGGVWKPDRGHMMGTFPDPQIS